MDQAPDRVDMWAHPVTAIVMPAVGLAATLWAWVKWPAGDYHSLIFEGIGVGLVCAVIWKLIMRRQVSFLAEFYLTPLLGRLRWRVMRRQFSGTLAAAVYGAGVGWVGSMSPSELFVLATWVPMIILYPEQKRIYRAAEERLESLRNANVAQNA